MHTIPAAKVVGHDFLGNHIGELLVRQPIKRQAPPPRNNASSNGSTVGPGSGSRRRSSLIPDSTNVAPHMTASASASSNVQTSTAALDSFLSVGALTPLGTSTDPIASLENSSESSVSEPSSIDSRSSSKDADMLLHLDQLPLRRKRNTSEGGARSPRVSFVTSFGAKPRGSGSRRAPSEAGSSSYFGLSAGASSKMSSASMSPMELPGGINWNMPFRDQHQSFAHAIEHNAMLGRNPSQESQSSSGRSSRMSPPPQTPGLESDVQMPTTCSGESHSTYKNLSFSGVGNPPMRQRTARAATESTLTPVIQNQQSVTSPGASSCLSGASLSQSNSMGTACSGARHRRKPSLVPKGDDERTFTFIDASSSSEAEYDDVLKEEPEGADMTLTSAPSNAAEASVGVSDEQPANAACRSKEEAGLMALEPSLEVASVTATSEDKFEDIVQSSTNNALYTLASNKDTPQVSRFPHRPLISAGVNSSYRPARRLRIQPNVQSRQSLLEKTMEDQRRASEEAKAASATGVVRDISAGNATATSPAVTPSATETSATALEAKAAPRVRYDPTPYGESQRTFRLESTLPGSINDNDFPFNAISTDNRTKVIEQQRVSKNPASHARTSDWARAQNLLADSPSEEGQAQQGYLDMDASCQSLSSLQISEHEEISTAPMSLAHTNSHSSTSTTSPSLLDNRELLSPPETAISTPELESPPTAELGDPLKLPPSSAPIRRRSSPLRA